MTDRAYSAAMNASDLWLDFFRRRIEAAGRVTAYESNASTLADLDLEAFRARHPHRVHDDKEGVK